MVHRLDRSKFEPVPIGITREGAWYAQDAERIRSEAERNGVLTISAEEEKRVLAVPAGGLAVPGEELPVDVAFPVLHGSFGEDGTVQGLLEVSDIPYVGAGVLGSSLGMDKELAKHLWKHAGLPTVAFHTFRREDLVDAEDEIDGERLLRSARQVARTTPPPWFVKPGRAGSSVGVTRVEREADFPEAAETALQYDTKFLVEPEVRGREVECSVMGTEAIRTFPPGEIRPRHGFYSYEAKYVDPEGAELFVPADLPEVLASEVRSIAAKAYRAVDCEVFARIDFFVNAENGEILLNEINTIPGFTSISMFPKLCEVGGLAYDDLLTELIELALRRHRLKSALTYQWS